MQASAPRLALSSLLLGSPREPSAYSSCLVFFPQGGSAAWASSFRVFRSLRRHGLQQGEDLRRRTPPGGGAGLQGKENAPEVETHGFAHEGRTAGARLRGEARRVRPPRLGIYTPCERFRMKKSIHRAGDTKGAGGATKVHERPSHSDTSCQSIHTEVWEKYKFAVPETQRPFSCGEQVGPAAPQRGPKVPQEATSS